MAQRPATVLNIRQDDNRTRRTAYWGRSSPYSNNLELEPFQMLSINAVKTFTKSRRFADVQFGLDNANPSL